jgi:hypothetical protein
MIQGALSQGRLAKSKEVPGPPHHKLRLFPVTRDNSRSGRPFQWSPQEAHAFPLGYTSDGRLLTASILHPPEFNTDPNSKFRQEFTLTGYTGEGVLKETTRSAVPFPPGILLVYPILAPTTDQLLWIGESHSPAATPYWLQELKEKLAGFTHGGHNPRMSLWRSDLDGKSMREIGVAPDRDYKGYFEVSRLPDGRHISFEQDGTLYVVPVP